MMKYNVIWYFFTIFCLLLSISMPMSAMEPEIIVKTSSFTIELTGGDTVTKSITVKWTGSDTVQCFISTNITPDSEGIDVTYTVHSPLNPGIDHIVFMTINASIDIMPGVYTITTNFSEGLLNNPPVTPSNPSPANETAGVDTNAALSWTGGDPDTGDIVIYDIYFGTDVSPPKIVSGESSTSFAPSLSAETTYYWKIVAWDNHGASSTGSVWSFTTKSSDGDGNGGGGSSPPNTPPIAKATAEPGNVKEEITFDGSKSYDPDGYIVSWFWDFGDDGTGTGETTTHSYSYPGAYNVTLMVTDDDGDTDTYETVAIIKRANRPPESPIIDGAILGNKTTNYAYTAVSTDLDNDTVRYFFDWGDGTNTTSDFLASGILYNTSHNWTTSGVYTIIVYTEDINGGVSGTSEMMVFIGMNIVDGINGCLIDMDNDGIYDVFYNATGNETTVELQDNGKYLIDGIYEYDPETGVLALYAPPEEDKLLFYVLLIILAAIGILIYVIFKGKKKKKKGKKKKKL